MQDYINEHKIGTMRKPIYIFLSFILIVALFSCKKENILIPTVLTGHVADTIRGTNISGYKIVLVKSREFCANWMCGTNSEEVATAYTDNSGNYSITFNYKLNPENLMGCRNSIMELLIILNIILAQMQLLPEKPIQKIFMFGNLLNLD